MNIDPQSGAQLLQSFLEPWHRSITDPASTQDAVLHHLVNQVGKTDGARFGQAFQSRRNVHAIAENVAIIEHHVTEIDADAVLDASVLGNICVAVGQLSLHLDGAFDGINDAWKLN